MSFAVVLQLMLVYAMVCFDAIMSSVITKYFGIISLVGSLCIQKSSYMSLIIIIIYPFSLSLAPTPLQIVKKVL